jgi:hypothetical protein
MMWSWDSITFLAGSLFVTVYVTVKIVEARHVASIILDQAFQAGHRTPSVGVGRHRLIEPALPLLPSASVEEIVRESRHGVENETQETEHHPYSARAILARCGIELANIDPGPDLTDDDPTDRIMIIHTDRIVHTKAWPPPEMDTDRLFTHGYEAHR